MTAQNITKLRELARLARNELAKSRFIDDPAQRDKQVRGVIETLDDLDRLFGMAVGIASEVDKLTHMVVEDIAAFSKPSPVGEDRCPDGTLDVSKY